MSEFSVIHYNNYPSDIAEKLMGLLDESYDQDLADEYLNSFADDRVAIAGKLDHSTLKYCMLHESLYEIMAMAENPYNSDIYRALYNVLDEIADRDF